MSHFFSILLSLSFSSTSSIDLGPTFFILVSSFLSLVKKSPIVSTLPALRLLVSLTVKYSSSSDVLNTSLEELDLPVRLTNSLKAGKVKTIGDFLTKDRKELTKMKNVGPKSIELVEEKLRERSIEKK